MRSEKIINLFYLLELTQFIHFQNVNFFLKFCIYRILYNNNFRGHKFGKNILSKTVDMGKEIGNVVPFLTALILTSGQNQHFFGQFLIISSSKRPAVVSET